MMGRTWTGGVLAAVAALVVGCHDRDSAMPADSDGCAGGKCDDVETTGGDDEDVGDTDGDGEAEGDVCGVFDVDPDEVLAECALRADAAFNPNRASFQEDVLRWSCADVDGRAADERGQEYCEYMAIVRLPYADGLGEPQVLGMNLGDDFDAGQTPFGLELDQKGIAALEADPDAVVGSCVFTTWNQDVEYAMREKGESVPVVHGLSVSSDVFRMKYFANTQEAAVDLLELCIGCIASSGDFENEADPLHDPFNRACYLNAELNGTEDRKSDTVLCAAAMRIGECGCQLTSGDDLVGPLVQEDGLGFPLGTWDDPRGLPPGCSYVPFGPSGQTIVTCDLTAAEVLQNAGELKSHCAQRYADDVVVHVPIPSAQISCSPWSEEPYASTCEPAPWAVGR